jgi:RNA polymerase sigma-70 factor (ECF subfamily)
MKSKSILDWESHLIKRAGLGDAVAFELLADIYRPTLMSLSVRMLRNVDDAKDAVQDTFVKAFRAIKDFDPERPVKPWLCRICANCCVDIVRVRRREGMQLDSNENLLPDPREVDATTTGAVQQQAIVEAIGRLPEKYRRIIFMRHYRHMDVIEIAAALGKPEGTIKSWLFRARSLLKKDLSVALG